VAAVAQLQTPAQAAAWLRARQPSALCADSRKLVAGQAFVAWPGYGRDARGFVKPALATGAVACLVEAEGIAPFAFDDSERIASLPGLKRVAGAVADAYHGQPSRRLSLVAVTGTNGKTSVASWVAQALQATQRRCGVIGTLGIGEPPALQATGLTTPDPLTLHEALAGFVADGISACAIEASSIGLVEHRLAGAQIELALFTNFTRDHLDYHGDMARYWAAKRMLFDWPGLRGAVINTDDPQGAALAAELQAAGTPGALWTVSLQGPARLRAVGLHYSERGLGFEVQEHGAGRAAVASVLVGDYNASNLLVVIAALRALGVPLADACAAAGTVAPVPGRLQRVQGGGIEVVVDYAHTPDALEKVLGALRPLAAARGGRLVCVFGCGGDRDPSKRPLMGAAAERLADAVIVTSDNPRSETPATIIEQVMGGMGRFTRARAVEDRHEAIAIAVREAKPGDVVLVAGKGHEDYQEVAGVRRPFSDLHEAERALAARAVP
jgi:MurE/MurF fusion protein